MKMHKTIYIAKVSIFVIFVLIVISGTGRAITYYVDFGDGSDSNNGTSTVTPLKHCPGDDNATGNSASIILSAGDKVIFKGAIQYNGRIDLDWSGAENQRIIYQGNTDAGDWGIGKSIIDGENIRNNGFYTISARNYITIKTFDIRNMVSSATGIYIGSPTLNSNYIKIQNCYVHHIGNWSEAYGGGGIRLLRPSNCIIDGNEIEKTANMGIALHGGRDCIVSNNTIHDYIAWGIDLNCDYRIAMDNIVRNNTLYDMYQHDTGYGGQAHTDYIFIRQGSPMTEENAQLRAIVERNLLYNNETFDEYGGTSMITVARSKDVIVRNNVLINPHSYYAVRIGWASWETGHKIYNNTIYAPRPGVTGLLVEFGSQHEVKNNIIVGDRCQNHQVTTTTDYNLYYAGSPSIGWNGNTWTNWTQTLGYDANGSNQSSIAAIRFVSTSGYPGACQNMDLSLQSDSPAVDVSTTLTGFSDDKEGISRPQGSAWDIGAYEYVQDDGDEYPPSSPTGLRIVE